MQADFSSLKTSQVRWKQSVTKPVAAVKTGIAVAGTVLVDKINEIAAYPNCGELTKITGLDKSVGGCVPNVGIDLKKIDPDLPVYAVGKIGADDDGEYVKNVLAKNDLDISGIKVTADGRTSFTEVMSVKGGQRTFFTYAGADGDLCVNDISFDNIKPRMLHLGYFLLLNKVDAGEGLEILKKATEQGIETSIDLVSENSDRYSLVLPCLPYTDYLIINEVEAGKLSGIEPQPEKLKEMALKLKNLGVRKKVIIHMRDCALCCSESGITVTGSVDIPREQIKGTTGAGDAFCAGALYAIYKNKADDEILDFASSAAVMALTSADATSGLCTQQEIIKYCQQFRRMETCL